MDVLIILFLNLSISIISPILLGYFFPDSSLTAADSIIFGGLLFVGVTLTELLFITKKYAKIKTEQFEEWESKSKTDVELSEIRRLFHIVNDTKYNDDDLYYKFFQKKLLKLKKALSDAVNKKEVKIDETMFSVTSDLLNSAFSGEDQDVFRAIHFFKDNEFFFDTHAQRYFNQVYSLLVRNKINSVKRIMVYKDVADLKEHKSQQLMAFHQSTLGYDFRVLHEGELCRILGDFDILNLSSDFGVYGTRFLYRGFAANSDEIIGSYSKEKSDIQLYTECFETCWDAGHTLEEKSQKKLPVTSINDLFSNKISIDGD